MQSSWGCFEITIEDIEEVCKIKNINFEELKRKNLIEDIALRFKKAVSWALDNWQEILEEAINFELDNCLNNDETMKELTGLTDEEYNEIGC